MPTEYLSSFVPEGRKKDSATILNLLTIQLGAVAHGVHYASIREEGRTRNAYLAESRLGLCDLVLQSKLLAEVNGWDWASIEVDGEERFKERMKEAEIALGNKKS